MEKKKKSIVIGVTSLLLITLILLGLTYAYYRTRIVGNTNTTSVSVTSKKTEVTYADGNATLSTTGTIEPGFTAEKEFTVKNTGSESVKFSIILDNIENTFTRDGDWTYVLKKGATQIATGTIAVGTHQILVGSETLASGNATYKLTVTYANSTEDQSIDMGESLKFRVNISEETQTWDNATSGTLLYAIKNSTKTVNGESVSMVVSTPTSAPGRTATAETEAEIASTQDDYGTSYYYRGNVTNNYVNYSGMCWRIVRVQGDGTIKLALADESGTCDASSYSTSNTKSAFINNGTDYSYKSGMTVNTEDFIFEDSDIPAILSAWSTSSEHTLDTNKLVDAEWCNDTAKTSISGSYSYYGAYDRLYPASTANPTLKCNTKGMEGTEGIEAVSQKYVGKIAMLTADEVAFAGATASSSNTHNYYLKINANTSEISYWTMSSYQLYINQNSRIFTIKSGNLDNNFVANVYIGVRPAVVLQSNVTIATGGNGTQSSPYVLTTDSFE